MFYQTLITALRSGLFLTIPAALAWLFGEPMVFPSLRPTAYVLAFRNESTYTAKTVIGGHGCGVIGGLISYYLIVYPRTLSAIGDYDSGLLLSAGAVLALVITVFLMLIFETSHSPACATTLIVSLGILSGWEKAILIMSAVAVLYFSYRFYRIFQS